MSIAIRKNSISNILEDIAFGPSDEDVLKDVQTHAAFTAIPVPTVVCKGEGDDPTITSITVDGDGLITDVDWGDEGDNYVAGDVLVFTQGSVSGRYTLLGSDLRTTTTTSLRNLSGVEIIGYTPGAGKTAAIFPMATWDALTQKPVANGGWTVSDSFAVDQVERSELDKLKDKVREAHGWLIRLHDDYVHYGQFYPNIVDVIGSAPLDWVHPAAMQIVMRIAPSCEALTIARRIATVEKVMKGMKDAAGAKEFFPQARIAAGIRLAQGLQPRRVAYPVFWVDPRTDPPARIKVRHVIDFSQATGYTEDGVTVAGLDLKSSQISNTADFGEADWIHTIPGNTPTPLRNITATPAASKITEGTTTSVTLTWDLPVSDLGLPVTGITVIHQDADANPPVIATPGPTATSYTFTDVPPGTHKFVAYPINADGHGHAVVATVTIAENHYPVVENAVADQTLAGTAVAESVDVANVFSDSDGDTLTITAGVSDTAILTAHMSQSGHQVLLQGISSGTATVTLTATDPDGLTVQDTFDVTVP